VSYAELARARETDIERQERERERRRLKARVAELGAELAHSRTHVEVRPSHPPPRFLVWRGYGRPP
jgi:hypothetical protein